jgi:Flagellar transcriptional activator (FlhC)
VINFCQILFGPKSAGIAREKKAMRVSDDRYARDHERLHLALRLIRHEARTRTIRQWTGLSDDRIRKLYRSYVLSQDLTCAARHRGKSPRQAAYFFRNHEMNFQATQLASLYMMLGLLHGAGVGIEAGFRVGSLESGALLCSAYDAYLQFHAPVSISFEHAWFLLFALARREEVGIAVCGACGGLRLRDLLAKHRIACGNCGPAHANPPLAPAIGQAAPC